MPLNYVTHNLCKVCALWIDNRLIFSTPLAKRLFPRCVCEWKICHYTHGWRRRLGYVENHLNTKGTWLYYILLIHVHTFSGLAHLYMCLLFCHSAIVYVIWYLFDINESDKFVAVTEKQVTQSLYGDNQNFPPQNLWGIILPLNRCSEHFLISLLSRAKGLFHAWNGESLWIKSTCGVSRVNG